MQFAMITSYNNSAILRKEKADRKWLKLLSDGKVEPLCSAPLKINSTQRQEVPTKIPFVGVSKTPLRHPSWGVSNC